ncbi:MAG: MATE family efflux transporter [Clostridia bacterium]|nr:MATE family efflux transporter [Clostridia bacterium]
MKNSEFLGTAPLGKLLFKLAIPTITAQLINMLYNIVDRIFIGRIEGVGDLALTGVGVCMPVILIVSAFAALISMGGAPRASIFMGKGDHESAERTLGNCFLLQVVISIVLTVLVLVFHKDFLGAFGASENTLPYAADYLKIYALGTIFVQLTLGMNAYITAQGFTAVSMITVSIGALSNIILDPIFIYALGMGVKGAALATVISQGLTCIFAVAFLISPRSGLRLRIKNMKPDIKIILPCIALGAAPFVMQASESVISICFNSSLLEYGGDIAVGAMTILTSVMQFAMLPLQGLAQGAQPITSYNYGAKNVDRVKRVFKLLLISSVIYSFTLWAFIMLCPRAFASVFTSDAALIDFTAGALRIYCGVLCIFGVQIACQMTFVSLGRAGASAIVAIVRKFVLLLPLIYIMPSIFTADKTAAVYFAEPVADIIAVSFTAILFSVQFRAALKSIENPNIDTLRDESE